MKGKVAPFNGQLISDAAFANTIVTHKTEMKKLMLETTRLQKEILILREIAQLTCDTKLSASKRLLAICEDGRKAEMSVYKGAIKRTVERCRTKWYQSPWFTMTTTLGGVVAGGLISCQSR